MDDRRGTGGIWLCLASDGALTATIRDREMRSAERPLIPSLRPTVGNPLRQHGYSTTWTGQRRPGQTCAASDVWLPTSRNDVLSSVDGATTPGFDRFCATSGSDGPPNCFGVSRCRFVVSTR